ncbi:MAG: tyrosine phosphatase family protein [Alphaproteobacteria bacterium]
MARPAATSFYDTMIYVCSLLELEAHADTLGPSRLVSLLAPEYQPPTPQGLAMEHHLRVEIDDISEPIPGHVLPATHHIEALIAFIHGWPVDGPMLFHCHAGVSRSMAAALIALCVHADGREAEAARHMRESAPHALPNRRMIALADELLGRDGRMVAAREAMGPAELCIYGPLVRMSLLP